MYWYSGDDRRCRRRCQIHSPHAAALDSSTNDRHRVPYPFVVAIVARWSCPSSAGGGGGGEFPVYVHMRLCVRLFIFLDARETAAAAAVSPPRRKLVVTGLLPPYLRRHRRLFSCLLPLRLTDFFRRVHNVVVVVVVYNKYFFIPYIYIYIIIRVGVKKEERRRDSSLCVVTAYGFCPLCMYVRTGRRRRVCSLDLEGDDYFIIFFIVLCLPLLFAFISSAVERGLVNGNKFCKTQQQ